MVENTDCIYYRHSSSLSRSISNIPPFFGGHSFCPRSLKLAMKLKCFLRLCVSRCMYVWMPVGMGCKHTHTHTQKTCKFLHDFLLMTDHLCSHFFFYIFCLPQLKMGSVSLWCLVTSSGFIRAFLFNWIQLIAAAGNDTKRVNQNSKEITKKEVIKTMSWKLFQFKNRRGSYPSSY